MIYHTHAIYIYQENPLQIRNTRSAGQDTTRPTFNHHIKTWALYMAIDYGCDPLLSVAFSVGQSAQGRGL